MTSIAAIVVTHNSSHIINAFADRISRGRLDGDELVIVDSGSEDASALRISLRGVDLRLVVSDDNIGYGAGNNLGVATSKAEWVAIVNPDVEVTFAQLHELVARADRHGVQCIAPGLRNAAGHPVMAERSTPRPPWIRRPPTPSPRLPVTITESVSGCCMVMSRTTYDQLGGFDEYFFMFCEEMDLHRRLLDAGGIVATAPDIVVTTDGGGSSASTSNRWAKTERDAAHVRYMRKHFGTLTGMLDFVRQAVRVATLPQYRPHSTSLRQFWKSVFAIGRERTWE